MAGSVGALALGGGATPPYGSCELSDAGFGFAIGHGWHYCSEPACTLR